MRKAVGLHRGFEAFRNVGQRAVWRQVEGLDAVAFKEPCAVLPGWVVGEHYSSTLTRRTQRKCPDQSLQRRTDDRQIGDGFRVTDKFPLRETSRTPSLSE